MVTKFFAGGSKYFGMISILIFFILLIPTIIYFIPHPDPDMYFHIKQGDIIAHQGLLTYDVLTQLGSQKQLLHYEWLFQIIIFWFTTLFGISSWKVFIWCVIVLQFSLIYILFRRIFKVEIVIALYLLLFFLLFTLNFYVVRPQVISFIFLSAVILILLLFLLKNKNLLILLLPITYIWTNIHSSVILSPILCLLFFLVYGLMSFKVQDQSIRNKAKLLGIYVIGVIIMTILPPQGFTAYQFSYMLLFSNSQSLIKDFIIEWKPLFEASFPIFILYISMIICILGTFIYVIIKKNQLFQVIWVLPLLLLIFMGFTSIRFIYYGYLVLLIILGWLFSKENIYELRSTVKNIVYFCMVVILGIEVFIVSESIKMYDKLALVYPSNSANFILQNNIQGNMFNQLVYGGYLEYRLYPYYKVFIDGRLDLFLCCEIPDYYHLMKSVPVSNTDFSKILYGFFDKYSISYVVLVMKDDRLASKISTILENDQNWKLVFWDDSSLIYVKMDNKNKKLLNQFYAKAATPFEENMYKKGHENEAYNDYLHLVQIQDSALSRNALGNILYTKGNKSEAIEQFTKAIQLNSTQYSYYYNLAVVVQQQQDYERAIQLYERSLTLNQNQINAYINLGILYQKLSQNEKAKEIWEKGKSYIVTEAQKELLTELIATL